MNILSVTHSYPRWRGDMAGAFIHRLNVALTRRSHRVTVIAPGDKDLWGRDSLEEIDVHRVKYAPERWQQIAYRGTMDTAALRPAGAVWTISLIARQALAIRELCTRGSEGIDLVHCHWWVPGGLSTFLSQIRTPYVVTHHGTDVRILERSAIARKIGRRVVVKANAVTAVSNYLADRVASLCQVPRSAIHVQTMPSAIESVARARTHGGRIITVGRLTKQKRIHVLLDAFHMLRDRRPDVCLSIVGDGPERVALQTQATGLGIENSVEFTGQIEPSDVAMALSEAAVFAFPAVDEGFGLAAAEALMMGVPVVASRSGASPDFVPEQGAGRLVTPDDAAALALALEELLDDADADSKAEAVGEELRARLSAESVAENYERIYEGVIGKSRVT